MERNVSYVPELVTFGETMVSFVPCCAGPLRYVERFSKRHAGAESNTAIGVCRLGHSAGWISRVGEDEFGRFLLQQIRGEGVDTSRVVMDSRPTGIMFKQLTQGGETTVIYYRSGSAASGLQPGDLDSAYLSSAKILHITGITPALSDSCLAAVKRAIPLAKELGVAVSFDPNLRLKLWSRERAVPILRELLFQCDIALLGLEEAALLLGTGDPEQIVALLLEKGVQKIGLKAGAQGAWVASPSERLRVDPYPAACVEPVGAGDAFNAGFLSGVLEGAPLLRCGQLACAMGAFAVMGSGDIESLPSCRRELENFLSGACDPTR